jgi:hypothetical protein
MEIPGRRGRRKISPLPRPPQGGRVYFGQPRLWPGSDFLAATALNGQQKMPQLHETFDFEESLLGKEWGAHLPFSGADVWDAQTADAS